jgi:hypothetical protein
MNRDLRFTDLETYRIWKLKSPDTIDFYFLKAIRGDSFAAILRILNPVVKQINGMYLRMYEDRLIQSDDEFFTITEENRTNFEYGWNRTRVFDFFYGDPEADKITPVFLTEIAEEILEYWKFNLSRRFPNVTFQCGILESGVDPEIFFFTERAV